MSRASEEQALRKVAEKVAAEQRLLPPIHQDRPTIYADLMDMALRDPRILLRGEIERQVQAFTTNLTGVLVDQLQAAYTAGVQDGFRSAVMKAQDPR